MPEFVVPIGSAKAQKKFNALSSFEQGYVEAMFFTSAGYEEDEELKDATFADLASVTIGEIERDCTVFQAHAHVLLAAAYERDYDEAQAGRDFWFTRNGHGVGFWDRKPLEADGLGDKLTEIAKRFREIDLYCGDNGKVYFD